VRRRRSRGSTGKGHAYVRGGRVRAMRVVMHVWQGVKERGAGLKKQSPAKRLHIEDKNAHSFSSL